MYQHFQGMGSKDVRAGYGEDRYPPAMLFVPLPGLGTPDNYKNHLDRLELSVVVMIPYGEHCEARPLERVSLFTRWLRYGDRTVRYMPERVLRQFGRIHIIPRHPVEVALLKTNLGEISLRFQHALDHALTPSSWGSVQFMAWRQGMDTSSGFISIIIHTRFFLISRHRCRCHQSVRSLMRELLRRMKMLGTYNLAML